jgi:hypothetical protein
MEQFCVDTTCVQLPLPSVILNSIGGNFQVFEAIFPNIVNILGEVAAVFSLLHLLLLIPLLADGAYGLRDRLLSLMLYGIIIPALLLFCSPFIAMKFAISGIQAKAGEVIWHLLGCVSCMAVSLILAVILKTRKNHSSGNVKNDNSS